MKFGKLDLTIDAERAERYYKENLLRLQIGRLLGEPGAVAITRLVQRAKMSELEQDYVNMVLAVEEYRRCSEN